MLLMDITLSCLNSSSKGLLTLIIYVHMILLLLLLHLLQFISFDVLFVSNKKRTYIEICEIHIVHILCKTSKQAFLD